MPDKENEMDTDRKPLGYITLLNKTQKPIYPMDDFFVNFAFYKKENWPHLRNMINIYLDAYVTKYNKNDGFHFVSENILVETQYEHYLKNTTKQPTQDMKIDEIDTSDQTYVELQNKAYSKPPIEIRGSNYSGLAVNKAKDGTRTSQIWLLGENDDNVLRGQAISNFRMKEENTGDYYPREVNIMFISLPRLAKENNLCGELSKFLMGEGPDVLSDQLKPIAEMFKHEYETFKENEEVIKSMTVLEERFTEGIAIGQTMAFENLLVSKLVKGESQTKLRMLAIDLGVSLDRLDELVKENKGNLKDSPVKKRIREER
jgi:hypothetical protein